jgi:chemotaxis regulatin CheY-phosphate phosphatase CheZ
MRADAYKQFNEAAIIQTVLTALPDIVRAAAEPMSHIKSLTVMSADGASDLVRNATRAMVESTTAIKGLTGLDVPSLIGGALGRGFGEHLRTGEGDEDGRGGSIEKAAADVTDMGAAEVTTLRAKLSSAVQSTDAKVTQAAAAASTAAKQIAAKVDKTAQVVEKTAQAIDAKAAEVAPKISPNDGNVAQWAKWLASQLREVRDIQVYGTLRLADLADKGPDDARAIWQRAQAVLGKDYGGLTLAELLKRF